MSSSDRRQDLRQAIQFAMQNLNYWKLDDTLQDFYQTWLGRLETTDESCDHLPPPKHGEKPRSLEQQLRYRTFLDHELDQHVLLGRLPEHLVVGLKEENLRIQAELRAEDHQAQERSSENQYGNAARESGSDPSSECRYAEEKDHCTSRSIAGKLFEAILDPRSLQYLMMLGSALLVLGLVIWLATQGFFKDPLVIAVCAAAVNLAALGGGAYLLRFTRFENAGRGLTLLACVAMPLHLWFYDAQGLIVLNQGGHLWIPALAIAVLYAVCAILIRDPLFAYAMVGGMALTGLMILGDQSIAKFWEGAAVSSLLMVIGAVAIHVERAFIPGEGPFNREEFGKAFYRAGHCVLLGGLIVLAAWTISSWTYDGTLSDLWRLWRHSPLPFEQPSLATSSQMKILALGLSLFATYVYGYSFLVVTRSSAWLCGGIVTFAWAEVMFVDLLPVPVTAELIMLVCAMTAIFVQVSAWSVRTLDESDRVEMGLPTLSTVMQIVACLFLIVPLTMGIAGYLRSSYQNFVVYEINPLYGAAMATTALAGWLGISLTRDRAAHLCTTYAVGSCFALLLGSYGGLALVNMEAWDVSGPMLMLIPLGYLLIATRFANGSRTSMKMAAQCGAILLSLSVLISAYGISIRRVEPITGHASELLLALFLLEVCAFYGLYSFVANRFIGHFLALLAGSAAVVQLEHYWGTSYEVGLFTFGLVGVSAMFVDRLLELGQTEGDRQYQPLGRSGQTLLSLAGPGSVLMALNRLMMTGFHGGTLALLLGMIAASLVAALLVLPQKTSRWYVVLAVAQGCSALLLVAFGLTLEPWQKIEVLTAAMGIAILAVSHFGWAQEEEHREEWVTIGLIVGSLMFALPVMTGLLGQRFDYYSETSHWRMLHEIGSLVAGLSLLGTGILFRIRSTTIVGTMVMLLYVGTLVVYVRLPDQLQGVAVYMMIGGGIFFVVSMMLSISRDYLLAMPERFRNRRGLFRVLTWR